MKYIPFCIALMVCGAHSNEAVVLDYTDFRAKGITNLKVEFSVEGSIERRDGKDYLSSFNFSVGNKVFELPKKMYGLDSPYFALMRIIDDSGINGNYFHIVLPFGEGEQCGRDAEMDESYKEFYIHYDSYGSVTTSGVRKAC